MTDSEKVVSKPCEYMHIEVVLNIFLPAQVHRKLAREMRAGKQPARGAYHVNKVLAGASPSGCSTFASSTVAFHSATTGFASYTARRVSRCQNVPTTNVSLRCSLALAGYYY